MTVPSSLNDRITVAKSVIQTGAHLNLSKNSMAVALGISMSTVYRMGEGSPIPAGKPYYNALLLIRIYQDLSVLLGAERASMIHWMTTPNRHLSGEIPADLIKTAEGLARLLEYLDSMVVRR